MSRSYESTVIDGLVYNFDKPIRKKHTISMYIDMPVPLEMVYVSSLKPLTKKGNV